VPSCLGTSCSPPLTGSQRAPSPSTLRPMRCGHGSRRWAPRRGEAPTPYDWIENLFGLDMHSAGRVLPLLGLLLVAAAISAFTGGATIIAAIMGLSIGLGFANEYRAARTVAALHGDIRYQALVWRDGQQRDLDVSQHVPGDIVGLRVGGVVPADLRILEADQLECDEAVLTGESMAAPKTQEPVVRTDSAVDLRSCAFMGTIVHQGAGRGVSDRAGR
jgi:magnesium-transporting ATPase (P-type)